MPNRSCLILCVLACLSAQEAPVFLRPLNKSLLPPGSVDVIARAGALTVDGKPVAGTRHTPEAFSATVHLAEGRHLLKAGSETIEIFVTSEPAKAPAGFRIFRPHLAVHAGCESCHEARDTRWVLKSGIAGKCLSCHDAGRFPHAHTHTPQVLQECEMCHKAHGSVEFFHLTFPNKEAACKQCHG